ncbi:MAG: ABC transporter permease, partial [Limisphaerales bacterium]
MRRTLRIALREYVTSVCTKGFLLGLVLAPVLMCGGLIGVAVTQRQASATDRTVAVVDFSGVVARALANAAETRNQAERQKTSPGSIYRVELVEPDRGQPEAQRLALSDRVRAGELHAFVEIGAQVVNPSSNSPDARVRYHARNPAMDDLRNWLGGPLNDQLRHARLVAAGIDPVSVTNLFAWVGIEGMSLVDRDAKTGVVKSAARQNEAAAVGVPMAVAMLAMLLVMMGSAPLLQSVMEEKTQRIAEVMLGAVTPGELMLGKLLGGVGVSLTAMIVYLAAASFTLGSLALTESVPLTFIPWFVAFVLGAILFYGAAAAALGSVCSDAKDAQQLQLPIMMPVMIPMFLMLPVIKEPQSAFAAGLSLFPPFTPLLMLVRMSTPGGVPAWQAWVGLAGLLACTAFALWLGGRIFRVGILMQGKLPRFAEMVRWGFRG